MMLEIHFSKAKALVIETQKASASMIQRRLSVGFNRPSIDDQRWLELLVLLKGQNLEKSYNNKLFENRIKIQKLPFENGDNLL